MTKELPDVDPHARAAEHSEDTRVRILSRLRLIELCLACAECDATFDVIFGEARSGAVDLNDHCRRCHGRQATLVERTPRKRAA